jgi:predicted PurR-regulated permease PerM
MDIPPSSQSQRLPDGLAPAQLRAALRFNLILLCVLGLLLVAMKLMQFFYDVFAIVGGALILTYFLLGPVNAVDHVLQSLCKRLPRLPGSFALPGWLATAVHHLGDHLSVRALSVLLVYLGFFLMLWLATLRLFPLLSTQVQEFSEDLPIYLSQLDQHLASFTDSPEGQLILENLDSPSQQTLNAPEAATTPQQPSPSPAPAKPRAASELISKNAIGQIALFLQKLGPKALHQVIEVATTTLEGMIYAIATLVIIFYLLLDGKKLKEGFVAFLPKPFQSHTATFLTSTHDTLYTFIKGQIILGFLAGSYMWFVYSLYGVKYAGFLGSFFGAASILPVVGPWLGLIPGVLVVLFSEHQLDLTAILTLTASFYFLKEYWLSRLIIGNVLEIHPVIFLLSFLTCVKLAGPVGLLLSFPVAALLFVTLQYFQNPSPPTLPSDGPLS